MNPLFASNVERLLLLPIQVAAIIAPIVLQANMWMLIPAIGQILAKDC